eukprot:TRINITY_DN15_c0_g1_i1.p1 TRINITY_DN15_c0_g1~~TRINITY_DN15_c0_g1_i1.p1  ORF type:complete len:211 (+),score=68.09 TRINITY_DN15_c0_g1_i1:87-719(+)
MAIKLYGRSNSGNVQKVLVVLELSNIEYELILAGKPNPLNKENPEYLAINKFGLVPCIVDEEKGLTLTESNTIIRYLDDAYGDRSLSSKDPVEYAKVNQWQDIISTNKDKEAGHQLFLSLIRNRFELTEELKVELETTATNFWDLVEDELNDHDYLASGSLSLADITIAPFLHRYLKLDINRPEYPNIDAYYSRLLENEILKKYIDVVLT